MSLAREDIEAIAKRVAELITQHEQEPSVRYLDARQLARVLGVDRDWIYAHASARRRAPRRPQRSPALRPPTSNPTLRQPHGRAAQSACLIAASAVAGSR